jgi:type IV secretion system protein VirB10
LTPLEKRMRSKTVIFDARSSRAGGAAREVPGFPGLRTDGSVADAETQSMLPSYLASSTALASAAAANQQQQPAAAGGAEKPAENDQNGVGAILRPTKLEGAAAARFPDRTLMIARGKLIDCTLDTAISTVVAGMTRCTLTRDVYGDDGKAVVLDRGTELTGEYRSNLRIGQARLGIVWSRAKTPGGVIIELDSPATDSLGRAGVDGYVDNHFWARYGAAILLSSLDDTLTLVTSRADRNQIYVPQNTSRTGRDAASVALEANVNIPPTIVKNQGEHVAVFVARDLDFRPVYSYRAPPIASNE